VIRACNGTRDYLSHRFHPSDDQGADTCVLVHVVPGRKGAVMIGLPRDPMVPVYGQFFMISVLQAALHQGLPGNPPRLLSVAHAVGPYLTTDSGFGLPALYGLARSMRGTELGKVQLIEVPIIPYPAIPMVQVSWQQPAADRRFTAVAQERPVPRAPRRPRARRAAPLVAPARVRVDVLNGNGVPGIAGRTSSYLAGRGFRVAGAGDAGSFRYPGTLIQYAGQQDRAAASNLGRPVAGARLQQVAGLVPGLLD
jgi:hypothetical protein